MSHCSPSYPETFGLTECRLVQVVDIAGVKDIFIGEIVEAYCEDRFLTNGLPDIRKMKPIIFSNNDNNYFKVGDHLAKAFSAGKRLAK